MIGQLFILRHAPSTANALFRGRNFLDEDEVEKMKKWSDVSVPLSDRGHYQAGKVANFFKANTSFKPKLLIHSGYERTRQTAEYFKTLLIEGGETIEDLLIREREPGCKPYMTESEFNTCFPWHKAYYDALGPFLACPPGGESMPQVVDRCTLFLNRLYARQELLGQDVLIVGHGQSMLALQGIIEGWDLAKYEARWRNTWVRNCEAFIYERTVDFRKLKFAYSIYDEYGFDK